MTADAPADYSARSRRLVQLVAGLGSVIAPFLVASMFVAAPTIGEDLGADVSALGWLTAAFFLAAASLLIPFGRIADVKGSKKVFAAGMAVYVMSAALCALAPDMAVLIIGRGLTGMGAAMVFGTSIALISLVFPEDLRGKAIGLNVTVVFAGFSVGLLAGGLLTFYIGWRALFAIAAALAAANLLLLISKVRGECELSRERGYDPVGMVLFAGGLLLVFFGLSEVTSDVGLWSLAVGGAIVLILLIWEHRHPRPIIGRGLTRNGRFRLAIATNVVFQAGSFALPFLLSLYSQIGLGLDPPEAALILLVPQVLMTAASSISGRWMARTGDYALTASGAAINVLGLVVLLLPGALSVPLMIVSLALTGVGIGLFMPALVDWAMGSIERRDYGVASAMTETARLLGMTVSNVVLILVINILAGAESVQQAGGTLPEAVQLCALIYLTLSAAVVAMSMAGKGEGRRRRTLRRP